MKNYYEILEVNKKASPETISKVYKFLAKKYHPDANPDNQQESEEKFKEISEAYEILSNEEKRKQYDLELQDYEASASPQAVSAEDFLKLSNYCKELENALKQYSSAGNTNSSNSNEYNNYYNNTNNDSAQYQTDTYTARAQEQAREQAYQDAVNRAYHDAYVNNLRNMGYKIRYKKTFKDQLKSVLALVIATVVLYILFKLIWIIPPLKNWFLSLFKISL